MANNIDYKSYGKEFSVEGFDEKIANYAKKVGLKAVYMALLLFCAAFNEKTALANRTLILGALGYFILPIDIIPDILPMGFTDDIAVLSAALSSVRSSITPDIEEKAKMKLKSFFPWYKGESLDIY